MARWPFQFWLSLPHCLWNLCTRYREAYGNISFPMPVSFFQCLLLWSRFTCIQKYGHGQGTHQSDLGADGDVLVVPMTFSLVTARVVWAILESTSGLIPSSDTIAPSYLKRRTDGLQFLVVYDNVSADAIGVICHQLGFLCTDLHAIYRGGLFKVIYQLDQLSLSSSEAVDVVSKMLVCNCPASDTDCSFMVFKCVSHYSL